MSTPVLKIQTVTVYFGLSVLVHLLVLISLERFGSYSFAGPVNHLQAVMVDLAKPRIDAAPVVGSDNRKAKVAEDMSDKSIPARRQGQEVSAPPPVLEENVPDKPEAVETAAIGTDKPASTARTGEPTTPTPSSRLTASTPALPPR